MVYGLVDYRNEEKKFEHLDFISNLSFTITVTVFTSISVEISRKIARPLEREKKNCATITSFPWLAFLYRT